MQLSVLVSLSKVRTSSDTWLPPTLGETYLETKFRSRLHCQTLGKSVTSLNLQS